MINIYKSTSLTNQYIINQTRFNHTSFEKKGFSEMTLICTKFTNNKIIIGVDSCLNLKNGNKSNIQKLFYNKSKSIIVAFAGDSSVIMNGKEMKINDIINFHLNKNYPSFADLKESLIHDIIEFLPIDKNETLGQIIFVYFDNEKPNVKGYQVKFENGNKQNAKIDLIVDSNSYFFNKKAIWSCGAINNTTVNNAFRELKLSLPHLEGKEIITKTMELFTKNDYYDFIGGDIYLATLDNCGNLTTYMNGIEAKW